MSKPIMTNRQLLDLMADIEDGLVMIVAKDHYYQLEAQAKSQPDLLNACEKTCFVCPRLVTKDCETCIVRKAIDKATIEQPDNGRKDLNNGT